MTLSHWFALLLCARAAQRRWMEIRPFKLIANASLGHHSCVDVAGHGREETECYLLVRRLWVVHFRRWLWLQDETKRESLPKNLMSRVGNRVLMSEKKSTSKTRCKYRQIWLKRFSRETVPLPREVVCFRPWMRRFVYISFLDERKMFLCLHQ